MYFYNKKHIDILSLKNNKKDIKYLNKKFNIFLFYLFNIGFEPIIFQWNWNVLTC